MATPAKKPPLTHKEKLALKRRENSKRLAIYNLKDNIDRLKSHVRQDMVSDNEKDQLTALVIRIMLKTSERVGNEGSAKQGHFGVTQFRPKHIKVNGNVVMLDYTGKSGVEHEKEFCDETAAAILSRLLSQNNRYLFTTSDGFRIKPDRVNRYLKTYGAKSKDIRGFNSNRLMVMKLKQCGPVAEEKERPKVFNATLRNIAAKIGHGAPTLRKHYLLPEIEQTFYRSGSVGRINID